jgi:hypothetical protein
LTATLPSVGTIILSDSLTYNGVADLTVMGALTIASGNNQRPLIRLAAATPWIITGGSADAVLALDGLFVSGQDIVLAGQFASVTITCSALDPGSAAAAALPGAPSSPPAPLFQLSADGRDLRPTRLWITGEIETLIIDRCVLGPIRTTTPGAVETTTISNTTLQAIRTGDLGVIAANQVKDPTRLLRALQLGLDPVTVAASRTAPGASTPASSPNRAAFCWIAMSMICRTSSSRASPPTFATSSDRTARRMTASGSARPRPRRAPASGARPSRRPQARRRRRAAATIF